MDASQPEDMPALVAALRADLQALALRVAELEAQQPSAAQPSRWGPAVAAAPAGPEPAAAAAAAPAALTEDEMLSIAAAVAAYLGVRARIRQVRLVQSSAWAQVGRATIHASHRIH